jgi:hypothetical protein
MVRALMVGAVVAMLAVVGACSGSSGAPRTDAAAHGMAYACAGGFIVTADGGRMAVADAGTPATCVVGQTYCGIFLPHPGSAGEATAECSPVPAVCAQDPTCACVDTNGFITISCEGI